MAVGMRFWSRGGTAGKRLRGRGPDIPDPTICRSVGPAAGRNRNGQADKTLFVERDAAPISDP